MAVNKRKVLDAARKYAQKGAKEKALKEYHTLLKLDPRDAKLHLEIGDCYRRWGQIDEAVTQYARVAEQYKDDGFDARAVAVFKQILNLDPKRYNAFVSLSELYQRMGLDSEALSALQSAADGYHKEGNKREALELLRKMATLDPTNTTSRLKVAELLRQEDMEGDAVAEYEAVIAELERQGATESILAVQERILELQPDRTDVLVAVGRQLIALEKAERAEPFVKSALEKDPENADAYEVLIEVYKAVGNDEQLATTTRTLAKMYRARGQGDKARELTQRIPLDLEFEAQDDAGPIEESESAFLSDDELLDEDFLASDISETADVSEELPLEDIDELPLEDVDESEAEDELDLSEEEDLLEPESELEPEPEPEPEEEPEPELPEGDPDQLLAEASVYLRYGKRDQAIASLEAILAQEPDNRAALEKIGEAYAEGEQDEKAVTVWCRAAQQARADGDDDGFSVLRDRIAALDADAAAELDSQAPVSAIDEETIESEDDEAAEDLGDDIDFEIDVSVGTGDDDQEEEDDESVEEPAEEDDSVEIDTSEDSVADALSESGADLGLDDEDDFDFETEVSEPEPSREVSRAEDTIPGTNEDDDEGFEFDIDVDVETDEDEAAEEDEPAEEATPQDAEEETDDEAVEEVEEVEEPMAAAASSGSADSQEVAEELEEAEFYFQQDLFEEAEAIYRRILKLVPKHPAALLRLGELAAAKGSDPSTPTLGDDSTEVAEIPLSDEDEPALQLDAPPADEESDASVSRADDTVPIDEEIEEPEEEADDVDEEDVEVLEDEEEEDDIDAQVEVAPAEEDDASAEEPEALAASDVDEDEEEESGGFDLAAELRDVLAEDEEADANEDSSSVLSTVGDGFESIFADFKQGVSATLSDDDYETRYDLGIAYREMELYEDAIGEFRTCLDSPSLKLGSLHMMGLCALDLGRHQDAANHLEQALATADLPGEQRAGLQFDLGRALEVAGDIDRARSAYEAALAADSNFPGVSERIAGLDQAAAAGPNVEDGQEFESFDDLVAEAQGDDDDTTEETESFESFDDVITEAEAVEEEEPVAEAVIEAPAAEEAPAEEEAPVAAEKPAGKKKKKKKKKISFV